MFCSLLHLGAPSRCISIKSFHIADNSRGKTNANANEDLTAINNII